jgi:hypothetical protein
VVLHVPDGQKVNEIMFSGTLSPLQLVDYEFLNQEVQFVVPRVDIYGLAVVKFK